jgi:hypothetical protein
MRPTSAGGGSSDTAPLLRNQVAGGGTMAGEDSDFASVLQGIRTTTQNTPPGADNFDYHSDSMLNLDMCRGISSVKPANTFRARSLAAKSKKPPRHVKGKQWRKTMRTGLPRGSGRGRSAAREAADYQQGRVAAYGDFTGIDLDIMVRARNGITALSSPDRWSPLDRNANEGAEGAINVLMFVDVACLPLSWLNCCRDAHVQRG